MTSQASVCGYFGKLPGAGDFIRQGLTSTVAAQLDEWMQTGLQRLIANNESGWEADFLAAPPWRFIAGAEVLGEGGTAGVMLPSRDKVARTFPCIAVAALAEVTPVEALGRTLWFDRVQAVMEQAVAQETAPDEVAERLAELAGPGDGDAPPIVVTTRATPAGVFVEAIDPADTRAQTLQAVHQMLPLQPGASLWWRHAADRVKLMQVTGLPTGQAFEGLFFAEPARVPAPADGQADSDRDDEGAP